MKYYNIYIILIKNKKLKYYNRYNTIQKKKIKTIQME